MPTPKTILIIDDDDDLREALAEQLNLHEEFKTQQAATATDGVRMGREIRADLILLDVMMPGIDGLEVCRQLRTFTDAYVLMLTARAEEIDTLLGLSVGADDYLTKPFAPRVLVARIRSLLRRPRDTATADDAGAAARRFGALRIDPAAHEIWLGDELVPLTRTEFDLLEALSARPHTAFTRAQLIERVWGPGWYGDERLVDIHLGHVRRKLGDDPTAPRYVRTVRGVGYRMGPG